jgi:hypothetical protein
MINSGVRGRAGLSGTEPAAGASESGSRAGGVRAQEKTSKTKKPPDAILENRLKSIWFILFYRKKRKKNSNFKKNALFLKRFPCECRI